MVFGQRLRQLVGSHIRMLEILAVLVFDQVGNLLGALPPILSRLFKFLVYNRGLDEVVYFKLIWLSVLLILQFLDPKSPEISDELIRPHPLSYAEVPRSNVNLSQLKICLLIATKT